MDLACGCGTGGIGEVNCSGRIREDFDGEAEGLRGRGGGDYAVVGHVAGERDRIDALSAQPGFEAGVREDAGELLADAFGLRVLVRRNAGVVLPGGRSGGEHRSFSREGRLVGLRADLRALFTAHASGGVPPETAVHAVNRALTRSSGALLLRFDPAAGFTRGADHPVTQVVEHVMAVIADDAASLLAGEQASQLASCEADSCARFFLRTHARRQWCSTRCGDRVRAARAYARKRTISA